MDRAHPFGRWADRSLRRRAWFSTRPATCFSSSWGVRPLDFDLCRYMGTGIPPAETSPIAPTPAWRPAVAASTAWCFEKSTGKVLLFGGGLATRRYDDSNRLFRLRWRHLEWDSARVGLNLRPTAAPTARYDAALVWDSKRSRAVLFGGMQKDQVDADGTPRAGHMGMGPGKIGLDERTAAGSKPSARYGLPWRTTPGVA